MTGGLLERRRTVDIGELVGHSDFVHRHVNRSVCLLGPTAAFIILLAACTGAGGSNGDAGDAGDADAPPLDSGRESDSAPGADSGSEPDAGPGDCGDGVCDDGETCADCEGDCGVCSVSTCLGRSGPVVSISGAQMERYRDPSSPAGTVFDATTAVWSGLDAAGDFIAWTVTLRNAGEGSCWSGGRIYGAWDETDPSVNWEDPYHHAGGFTIDVSGLLLEGVRIDNQGDGIRPYGPDAHIRAAHLTDIHDDCIENDDMYGLVVEDSLLDGCYVALSARTHSGSGAVDGSGRVWEVRDTLIRLEPQPTVYRGATPGHGGFFKWDDTGVAPRLSMHDTILRADQLPNHGELGIPDGLVFESCSNNTIVWLGPGPYPATMPTCFTVTTDRGVWDEAVRDWYARHPDSAP